jgi:cation diffusion facilitator CzcD-associated flavoprotein CzcO
MIIIGAGAAGLQIAYKAERQLSNVSFTIYEKNDDVGGTWLENRYPGCTCDIPSHSYQWSFWRNPGWSSYYAGAPEIWRYLKDFAVTFGLERYVQLRHEVREAKWVEEDGVWEVEIKRPDGSVFVDKAEMLVCCNGVLNKWKYPDIPGIEKFGGKLMHTARWDDSYDLSGKTVAVIGGGSSAVQTIPSIQPRVKKLIPFLRSPVWITAGFGAKYAAPGGVNFQYPEEQKQNFENDEEGFNKYCRDVEGELNKRFTLMHLNSKDQKVSRDFVAETMKERLGDNELLKQKLIPNFALGCRRMTPGSDYLESLSRPNVSVVTDAAASFTSTGVVDASGTEHKVDVVVCATGFAVNKAGYRILGRKGRDLHAEWADLPKSYMALMQDGFPNMFYFIGPNGPASHGSLLPILEWGTRYMFKLVTHMQRTSIRSLCPSRQACEDLSVHTHELLKRTAWSTPCSSWFKSGKTHGPVTAIWPGSRLHWFETLAAPRWEDFDVDYVKREGTQNRFGYLGNGYTQEELDQEGNSVWYFDVLKRELDAGKAAFEVLGDTSHRREVVEGRRPKGEKDVLDVEKVKAAREKVEGTSKGVDPVAEKGSVVNGVVA